LTPHTRLTEIRRSLAEENLPDKLAGRVPNLHTVATPGVDVAFGIAVNSVGESRGDMGKGHPIVPSSVVFDVVSVTKISCVII